MTIARTFVIHGPVQAKMLHAFLKANAAAMAEQGRPLQIIVSEYRAKRSNEQNSLLWALLQQIADQAYVAGRRFSAEVWHQHLKERLLPEETAKGVPKWDFKPNGERFLHMGTTDLNTAEFGAYVDALQAFAATELGVQLTSKADE